MQKERTSSDTVWVSGGVKKEKEKTYPPDRFMRNLLVSWSECQAKTENFCEGSEMVYALGIMM
jgi:hypothetical protein